MITRLQVQNFKSLRKLDIPLGPLNVLVGSNMAGKSNIIDALWFLQQAFFPEAGTQGISYALAQRGGPSEVLWKGGEDKLLTIGIEVRDETDPGTTFKYLLEIIAGAGNFMTIQNESLKVSRVGIDFDLLRYEGGMAWLTNADGKDLGRANYSGSSAFQYAAPNWDGYRLYENLKQWRFYRLIPAVMKQPSLMSVGQALNVNGENISAWLMWLQANSPELFGQINEVLQDLFPDVIQVKLVPTSDGKVHLAMVEKGLKRPTTVWQASDGLLAVTALLSLIYTPPELSGTLFCIEEPENHLHPRLMETLVALMRQVRQKLLDSKLPLGQIIITTQSPHLVDQMSLDEIIWVERKDGETTAYHPADKESLRKLVQNKELGLGDLMYSGALSQGK